MLEVQRGGGAPAPPLNRLTNHVLDIGKTKHNDNHEHKNPNHQTSKLLLLTYARCTRVTTARKVSDGG